MDSILKELEAGHRLGSGPRLAAAFTPVDTPEQPNRLKSFYNISNAAQISASLRYYLSHISGVRIPKQELNAWVDILSAYWKAIGEIVQFDESPSRASWVRVFDSWKDVANLLIRAYSSPGLEIWTIPCLYVVGKYLRTFASKADAETSSQGSLAYSEDEMLTDFGENAKTEEAARVLNRMFTLCLNDRAPKEESRKWGVYYMTNLLFKTYFQINAVGLSKNLLRALNAQSQDLPDKDLYPRSHIVTFNYFVGVIFFLDENYAEAEEHLAYAWNYCHNSAIKNRELILTYLVPCHLVNTHTLPSKKLLHDFPRLERLFRPLCDCIRKGDLHGFDAAMIAGEEEFVRKRIYLPLERGRDIALRNLFRKVFIAGGFEESKEGQPPIRRTRIPVAEFAAALRIGTHADARTRVDIDEVECLLSNLIYKGLTKGYIARERGMIVLSKGGTAFPGTGV
ncbi:protein csn12 [Aspergillus puulaauensis]|uniref:Protein CSN12 homolog n=1 Tax=Aspergillus puulaauensis TaxID=1220207 RepID=A0A7R7XCH0_9EURO|nr:COP9 signalosome (CSN) subunit [Aspergillus puulaauensis]BCS18799.1 COP9 signalosome (CSN) subunit [Aspergillus puulaauensis]